MNGHKNSRHLNLSITALFFMTLFFTLALIWRPAISQAQQEEAGQKDTEDQKILLFGTPERANEIIDNSISLVKDMLSKPDRNLPPEILRNAAGIALIPDMVKAGFVPGGRRGEGVLLVNEIHSWSPPVFLTITGGDIGSQINVTWKDLVFVFTNSETIERLKEGGSPALGLEITMKAGPSDTGAGQNLKDVESDAEILAYSRSEDGFKGISLTGGILALDRDTTLAFYDEGMDDAVRTYYGKQRVLVNDLLSIEKREGITIPEAAEDLSELLVNFVSERSDRNGR